MADCTYCGQDLDPYDVVRVEREHEDAWTDEGLFCNYGCLSAWLDESNAAEGACCRIDG
jgi:hypothetical protein